MVSVIIPFYNEPHLRIAIESIRTQTIQDFELLLIDNSSTDDSVQVAKYYAKMDSKIHYLIEKQRGVVFAMNTGIARAKGEFILRMDADDYSYPDRIEKQLHEFERNPSLGVVSGRVDYEGAATNRGFVEYVDWLNSIVSNDEIRLNQFVEFPLANPSLMFRREVFDQFGVFREGDFPEDYEYFLRLQLHGVNMSKVPDPVLKWRDSDTRLTRTDPRYSQVAFFKLKATYLAKWLKENNPFHPDVWVWGAGRVSRRRSDDLKSYDVNITHYIDIKEGTNILHYDTIPSPNDCFIVSYVRNRGARAKIQEYLANKGFEEGRHFILAS